MIGKLESFILRLQWLSSNPISHFIYSTQWCILCAFLENHIQLYIKDNLGTQWSTYALLANEIRTQCFQYRRFA